MTFKTKPGRRFSDAQSLYDYIADAYPLRLPKDRDEYPLHRELALLERLDNPHRRLPPVFHVAGTNGKGSTLAFLESILGVAGYVSHKFTSPHLVKMNERFVVGGREITDDRLIGLFEECEQAFAGIENIARFEILTAMAMLEFSREPADTVLLETGVGGRFDATNVLENPAVTLISRISHDHHKILGTTLHDIARAKAGIMKKGVPCVVGRQPSDIVLGVLEDEAQQVQSPLFVQGRDFQVDEKEDGFFFNSNFYPKPSLIGSHQIENAGLALAALSQAKGFKIDAGAIKAGLISTQWRARFQRLVTGPLVDALPPGCELWLDGAHNDSGAEALASQLKNWGGSAHLIVSVVGRKDLDLFLTPLRGSCQSLAFFTPDLDMSFYSAQTLCEHARSLGITEDIRVIDSLEAGIRALIPKVKTQTRIVIAGSLYLAGMILKNHA